MKVFISMPMAGKTEEQIIRERNDLAQYIAEVLLVEKDIQIIDSVFECVTDPDINVPLMCLGKSLECLSYANVAVFAKGWQQARGCWIEHECCIRYNIPILYA